MIKIVQIPNSPISSNSYLIFDTDSFSCIIIDPGTFDNTNDLNVFVKNNNLKVGHVILTHEHFDHIAGLINLQDNWNFEILCSENTAHALTDPKKNLSAFNDQMNPVIINQLPTILADNVVVNLLGSEFHFLITPGHSPGSLCFLFDQHFFSGDTLLNQQKTRLNLPGSDKEQFKLSIEKINKLLKKGIKIYPGHGKPFIY